MSAHSLRQDHIEFLASYVKSLGVTRTQIAELGDTTEEDLAGTLLEDAIHNINSAVLQLEKLQERDLET